MVIKKFSERLSLIVPDDCKLNKLASGFIFSEGPVWDSSNGSLYFTDFPAYKVYKLSMHGKISIFRENSGRAVGMAMDRAGKLIFCETQTRRISGMYINGDIVTLASHHEGKRLNSPNDAIVKSDGTIYFTDPYSTALGAPKELTVNGVYKIFPKTGETILLADSERPNGLAFSPDETLLYIDDTNLQCVKVYDVTAEGKLENGRLFAQMDTAEGSGAADGMKVDSLGNIYVTGPGGIWIFAPGGRRLGILKLPEVAANLCWGGSDSRTLFITATTSVYSLYLNIPGIS